LGRAMTPEYIRMEMAEAIAGLPAEVGWDERTTGVIRSWLHELPLRYQGVLVTAIRGCDGAPKEDPSKVLSSMVRRAILNPADPRETLNERGFFGFSPTRLAKELPEFLHSMDQYPLHFVMHLLHACEVIGYHHPTQPMRRFFELVYRIMCHKFHVHPETASEMEHRLTFDRVAAGTTARDF
jgi:hypothetical protein